VVACAQMRPPRKRTVAAKKRNEETRKIFRMVLSPVILLLANAKTRRVLGPRPGTRAMSASDWNVTQHA
jgi:hypothetical protein